MLNLSECERLEQLPKHLKMLVNLRHLYIAKCVSLTHMPHGLGRLTSPRNLSMFIVAKDNGISRQNAPKFEAANLKEKQHLRTLVLSWKLSDPNDVENDNDNEEISIEELRPHLNLKWLVVFGCRRLKFPSWVYSLANLVILRINNCKKCQHFPPLDQFPFLRELAMENLTDLEYIESADDQMSESKLFFPSLEKLWLMNFPKQMGWWRPEMLQFHCLVYLDIRSCPNLTSLPLIPSVETLIMKNASMKSLEDILKMRISVSQSTSSSSSSSSFSSQLKTLQIEKIEGLEFLAKELMQNLTSLEQLAIIDCLKITALPRALRHLTSLKVLIIRGCHELDFLDDESSDIMQWHCLRSLEALQHENMDKLASLPQGLQHVPTLRKLHIYSCSNLMCLPDWMPNLMELQLLVIKKCPQLSERCNNNEGVDWPKIAHIPEIGIDGRYIQYHGSYKL